MQQPQRCCDHGITLYGVPIAIVCPALTRRAASTLANLEDRHQEQVRWHLELTCTPVGDAVVCHAQEFPPKSWEDFVDAYDRGRAAGVHSARYFGVAVEPATEAVHQTKPASD